MLLRTELLATFLLLLAAYMPLLFVVEAVALLLVLGAEVGIEGVEGREAGVGTEEVGTVVRVAAVTGAVA